MIRERPPTRLTGTCALSSILQHRQALDVFVILFSVVFSPAVLSSSRAKRFCDEGILTEGNSGVRFYAGKLFGKVLTFAAKIIPGLLFICLTAPYLYAETDSSLRTDLNFNYTINEKFRAVSYVFSQADKDMSNWDYVELGAGLQYQTSLSWLSFLVWYQQGYTKDPDRRWLLEQKPSINMNTVVTLSRFKVSNQIRYEYRITPDWNDYRIKNTLEIARPDIFLQPCVGWELFYENRDRDVTLSRIKLGIIKNVGNHVSLGPYYRLDYSKTDHQWKLTRQLVGFQVTINY